jgi:hypothetical protein
MCFSSFSGSGGSWYVCGQSIRRECGSANRKRDAQPHPDLIGCRAKLSRSDNQRSAVREQDASFGINGIADLELPLNPSLANLDKPVEPTHLPATLRRGQTARLTFGACLLNSPLS